MNRGEFSSIIAGLTQPDICLRICRSQEAAFAAGIALEPVTAFHEALLREFHDAMGSNTVALHFSESEATFPGTAFRRLPG